MITDQARVQNSAAISFGLHGAAVGAFLLLRVLHPIQKAPMLTRVEFIDLTPPPVEAAAPPPARQAPRSAMDFLKMALPHFSRPAATEMKDVAMPQERTSAQLADMPKAAINLNDKPMLRSGPSIDLNDKAPDRGAAASLADVAVRRSAPSDLAAPQEAPTKAIDLDAAGRVAVRPAAPSIRLDGAARGGGSTAGLAELASAGRAAPSGGPPAAGLQEGGISLNDSAPVRRGSLPTGARAYGYGRAGISLADGPVGRPAAAQLAVPARKRAPAEAKAADVVVKTKGLEISGPLAGRKLLSASMPKYPEWARSQGVEADVSIRFYVDPDGHVLDRMIVERTSGYDELDRLSMDALRKMIFAPLPGGQEDQWGIVTFRFRLK